MGDDSWSLLLREKSISTACLLGSGLNDIFHWEAKFSITLRSEFNSKADNVGLVTIENKEVSSAKNLTFEIIPFSKSFM